jgi:hypothetical protein
VTETILGAGLSGLIAAYQFPSAQLLEACGPQNSQHKAVLRFRTDALSRLTGIPFNKVRVRKSIWYDGRHTTPTIQLANWYSRKTNGNYIDRSIWNIDAVDRYIAPEDLQQRMVEYVRRRIHWNAPADAATIREAAGQGPVISTIPMPALVKLLGMESPPRAFDYAGITVDRYRITNANLYQTIYYPAPNFPVYRASITKDLLIVERTANPAPHFDEVLLSFGIMRYEIKKVEYDHHQKFGKIAPMDDTYRRATIFNATLRHQVYSLGRFAVWRNILLDDVVDDATVIKRLITQGNYSAALHNSKEN